MRVSSWALGALALFLAILAPNTQASVIGIDLGSDFMKVALVQMGVPLEIVPNHISKRKSEVAVAFDRGERHFGVDAAGLLGRKPKQAFTKFGQMLGRSLEHPSVKPFFSHYFGTTPYFNETRGGVNFALNDAEDYSVEELTAMVFHYAKDITKAFGGLEVRDCVIAVPSFATIHERRAIIAAAEIAHLKVLSLIEDNTAAALQYGKDNLDNKVVLYYNMGSASTQVSVVRYGSYMGKEHGKNKTIGYFDVLGKAWDQTLGGTEFDIRLTEYFADEFNKQWGQGDVRELTRPMAKLRQQATKTKHVLSANQDIPVRVTSLHDDRDLVVHITRSEFEHLCTDLFDRVTGPIDEALKAAGLTKEDLDAVEVIGGAQRVPKVHERLQQYFGKDRLLGVHLNADESIALGAAFRAANLSTSFKVRKTGMSDYSMHGIDLKLLDLPLPPEKKGLLGSLLSSTPKESNEEPEEEWVKSTTLFPEWSRLDSKRTIAFHHTRDVSCTLTYGEDAALAVSTPRFIGNFNITGVHSFAEKNAEKCNGEPKVQLTFKLEASGLVDIARAEATCEPLNATNETSADVNSSAVNKTKHDKKKNNLIRGELHVVLDHSHDALKAFKANEIATSQAKLAHLQLLDDIRMEKEEAKNTLESFIYSVRNRMEDEAELMNQVTTEEQREELSSVLSQSADWLDDEGFDVDAHTYREKKVGISILSDPIYTRAEELSARPKAVAAAEKRLKDIRALMDKWKSSLPQVTDAERAEVLEAVQKTEDWLNERVEEQRNTELWDTPKFYSHAVSSRLQPLASKVTKLSRKPKPVVKNTTTTNSTNTTTPANTTSSTDEGTETKAETKTEADPEATAETSASPESAEESKDKDEL